MPQVRSLLEALPLALAWCRRGRPAHVFYFEGGIGDDLLCTAPIHELRARGCGPIWMLTQYPELFRHNPDIALAVRKRRRGARRFLELFGVEPRPLNYAPHVAGRGVPPRRHVITTLCESVGIRGSISRRPYFHLQESERARCRFGPRQIAVQSSGLSARFAARTKEWYPERLQQVVDRFRGEYTVVQVGAAGDAPLRGAVDLRGKTGLRETAAVLGNSEAFVGLAGFLQQLARSVSCRAVIVYGGRELPSQTGYGCHENVVENPECSPCWLYDRCEHGMKCMDAIGADRVAQALERLLRGPARPAADELDECGGAAAALPPGAQTAFAP